MYQTKIYDKNLNPVLRKASDEDLEPLVEYIKEKFSEELTINEYYKRHSPRHSKYADLIAKEIRDMGGNSFANLFRGFEGPSYHEIVYDVANKIKAPCHKEDNIKDIENAILESILKKALERMSESEKRELLKELGQGVNIDIGGLTTSSFLLLFRSGGFYSYQLTVIIANQIARLVLGRGLAFATNTALVKTASVLAGPVGWVVSGLWTAIDIAGPAYTVTTPCVIHIAMLRKKLYM